ncbi:hypothetical protein KP79_PYT12635 [Mizuhopecten yessoensis]|uniref:PH domain-containing protein n=1 Tax=Mizuhopecten yessoensis TaxID=6573 RepID=A0A210Q4Y3_MIZYE|nr:hypothetical protein KP79_PYT12635 [Mizuhopecten yessoensis]
MKSGHFYMKRYVNGKIETIPVFVRVYKNSLEHYAVVCESQTNQNSSLYINLKNSEVLFSEESDRDIMVVTEGSYMTFRTLTSKNVVEWLSFVQPISKTHKKKDIRKCSTFCKQMPILTEAFQE